MIKKAGGLNVIVPVEYNIEMKQIDNDNWKLVYKERAIKEESMSDNTFEMAINRTIFSVKTVFPDMDIKREGEWIQMTVKGKLSFVSRFIVSEFIFMSDLGDITGELEGSSDKKEVEK